MTREQAIIVLNMVEAHGLADEAKRIAIEALEQEPCIQEKQANADKMDAAYMDGFKAGYSQAKFDLDQESCDVPDINVGDMISRQAAIDAANKVIERDTSGNNDVVNAMISWSAYIKSLPPVKPQYTEDEIQKIQDLEQAQIQKAYELGKAEGQESILNIDENRLYRECVNPND